MTQTTALPSSLNIEHEIYSFTSQFTAVEINTPHGAITIATIYLPLWRRYIPDQDLSHVTNMILGDWIAQHKHLATFLYIKLHYTVQSNNYKYNYNFTLHYTNSVRKRTRLIHARQTSTSGILLKQGHITSTDHLLIIVTKLHTDTHAPPKKCGVLFQESLT